VSRRAVRRHGGDQSLERLSGKQATLCLAQVGVGGIPPDPEVGKLTNRPSGLKALQAQRSSDAGGDLGTIGHDIDFTGSSPAIAFIRLRLGLWAVRTSST